MRLQSFNSNSDSSSNFLENLLLSPDNYQQLSFCKERQGYLTEDGSYFYPVKNKVLNFLQRSDDFYEGAYLNRIKFIPSEKWYGDIPLWIINSGYMHEVKAQFAKGSILLELGCASGVDYFGKNYRMIGLDLSFRSLEAIENYELRIQADASSLPIRDNSLDGIISSYFWEHIPPSVKSNMLKEFKRVLKPGGKLIFLYDVETSNGLLKTLKKNDPQLYSKLFLEKDGHLGYETPEANKIKFENAGFKVKRHFGMERTWLQSGSVYEKLRRTQGVRSAVSSLLYAVSTNRIMNYIWIAGIRLWDESFGRLWPLKKSRILISVAEKSN